MTRLIAPNGATVNVDPDKVERLRQQGFREADKPEPKKVPAKKAAAKPSDDN